jgi:hypothetical protein
LFAFSGAKFAIQAYQLSEKGHLRGIAFDRVQAYQLSEKGHLRGIAFDRVHVGFKPHRTKQTSLPMLFLLNVSSVMLVFTSIAAKSSRAFSVWTQFTV